MHLVWSYHTVSAKLRHRVVQDWAWYEVAPPNDSRIEVSVSELLHALLQRVLCPFPAVQPALLPL